MCTKVFKQLRNSLWWPTAITNWVAVGNRSRGHSCVNRLERPWPRPRQCRSSSSEGVKGVLKAGPDFRATRASQCTRPRMQSKCNLSLRWLSQPNALHVIAPSMSSQPRAIKRRLRQATGWRSVRSRRPAQLPQQPLLAQRARTRGGWACLAWKSKRLQWQLDSSCFVCPISDNHALTSPTAWKKLLLPKKLCKSPLHEYIQVF